MTRSEDVSRDAGGLPLDAQLGREHLLQVLQVAEHVHPEDVAWEQTVYYSSA